MEMSWGKSKKSKYSSIRQTRGTRSFASKLEAARYDQLLWLEKAKQISELKCQVQVLLTNAAVIYKPDFNYFDHEIKQYVWEEVKGFETPEWRIKRRLWMFYGPGILRIYKGSVKNLYLAEEIHGDV